MWTLGVTTGQELLDELSEGQGGTRRGRRLAPQRRRHVVDWPSQDTTGLHTAGSAPNYLTLGYTAAPAIATRADTPTMLAGITSETGGAELPIVFCPAIPQPAAAPT